MCKVVNPFNNDKIREYNAVSTPYLDRTPWSTVEQDILVVLDRLYTKIYSHRVYSVYLSIHAIVMITNSIYNIAYFSTQFTLKHPENTALDPKDTISTVEHLWNQIIRQSGFHLTKKAKNTRRLELIAVVEYPLQKTNEPDGWLTGTPPFNYTVLQDLSRSTSLHR